MSERNKNILFTVLYTLLTFGLIVLGALLIDLEIDFTQYTWSMLLTYIVITTLPIIVLRLFGNRNIKTIKIGILPIIIFAIIIADFDSAFVPYSILFLSALNTFDNGNNIRYVKRVVKNSKND